MNKLLIMASLFWPQKKSGGPPISIMNLVMAIKGHYLIYIIANNHEINETCGLPGVNNGWNEFEFGMVNYIPHGQHGCRNVYRIISEVKPDVIYQNSFFSANDILPVLIYKKMHPAVKVIIAPRGELYPERIKNGYTKKKIYCIAFRLSGLLKNVCIQGTSEEECSQANRLLGIKRTYEIQNIPLVRANTECLPSKREGEANLVFIARIHPMKNVLSAIRMLRNVEGNVNYHLYGPIEDKEYWLLCKEEIANLPQNICVEYKGMVEHESIGDILRNYHCYYMPTIGENFGHSIVEAMMCGVPVLISDQTPWTDVNGHGGWAVQLDKPDAFINSLNALVAASQTEFNEYSSMIKKYIKNRLNLDSIVKQYIRMFDEV